MTRSGNRTCLLASIINGGKRRRSRNETVDETNWFDEAEKIAPPPQPISLNGYWLCGSYFPLSLCSSFYKPTVAVANAIKSWERNYMKMADLHDTILESQLSLQNLSKSDYMWLKIFYGCFMKKNREKNLKNTAQHHWRQSSTCSTVMITVIPNGALWRQTKMSIKRNIGTSTTTRKCSIS